MVGEKLGVRRLDLFIPKYGGIREIREQEVKPLHLLEDADEVKKTMIARGRKFEQFAVGQHFLQYAGLGLKRDPQCPRNYIKFDATGRV